MSLRLAVAGVHLDGFSGIPRHLIAALREHAEVTEWPLPEYRPTLAKRLLVRASRGQYLWEKDPARCRFLSRAIDERAAKGDVDAVLLFGSEGCAFCMTGVPLFGFGDSIFGSRVGLYGDQQDISPRSLREGVEVQQRALDKLEAFFSTSRWAIDRAAQTFGYAIPADKIVVTGIGANLPHVDAAPPLPAGALRLLWVGVDWERKGGDLAISAVAALRARGVDARLDVVGPVGPVQVPRTADWLTPHGRLEGAALGNAYASASSLLLPTRADLTPIVIAEAAMYGRPTFASNVGGIPEMIAGGGVLMDSQDAEAWAAEIARAPLDDLGAGARQSYEQRLNWRTIARLMVERMRWL
jgi:glycosyltransferase involved in cell wall biosynthesis